MKRTICLFILFALAPALPGMARAAEPPEEVEIDSLQVLYEPVLFDHAMHNQLMEENCAICHHHTTGLAPVQPRCGRCHQKGQEAETVSCQECHPANRYDAAYLKEMAADPLRHHTDKVGLKGAYHRLCLGCHEMMEAPTDCQECHPRTDAGDRRFRAGSYAPTRGEAAGGH